LIHQFVAGLVTLGADAAMIGHSTAQRVDAFGSHSLKQKEMSGLENGALHGVDCSQNGT
jgi:hypothetical protein